METSNVATKRHDSNRATASPPSWLVPAALMLPICLVGALLIQARSTERRQQALVQSAMRDYSAVAAWQLSRRASDALHTAVSQSMRHVSDLIDASAAGAPIGARRDPAVLLVRDSNTTKCAIVVGARYAFRVDLPEGRLTVTDSTIGTSARTALVERIRIMSSAPGTEPHAIIFDTIAGVRHVLALGIVRDREHKPLTIYGIEADSTIFEQVFRPAIEQKGLLPPALVGDTLTPDRIRVRLATTGGLPVFALGAAPTPGQLAVDTISIASEGQHLLAAVELEPSLASSVLVGGVPKSPLPGLVALFALAVVLALVAFYQLARARELVTLRSRFVANVSHELRTPLTQISMFAETLMLERERSAGERVQFATIVHREARRLANLVESVLRFSAADAGRGRLEVERRNLAADLRDSIDSFRPIARAATVELELAGPDELFADTDAAAIHQVVVNLLDNAVKHGGPDRTVRVLLARDGGEARISVDDEGPGVPDRDVQRVFEPFTRIEDSSRARVPGAGIGLAVVSEIVRTHHGRVWVERAPSGGARFVIALPAAPLPVRRPLAHSSEADAALAAEHAAAK